MAWVHLIPHLLELRSVRADHHPPAGQHRTWTNKYKMKIFTAAILLVNLLSLSTAGAATDGGGRLLKAEDVVEILDISDTPSVAPSLSLATYLATLAPTSLVDKPEDTERQDGGTYSFMSFPLTDHTISPTLTPISLKPTNSMMPVTMLPALISTTAPTLSPIHLSAMSMPPTAVPAPVPTVSPDLITAHPVTLPPVTVTEPPVPITAKPSPDFSFLTSKPVTPPPVPTTASPVAQKVMTAAPVVTSPPVMPPTTKKPKATPNPAQEEKEDKNKKVSIYPLFCVKSVNMLLLPSLCAQII